MTDTVDSQTRSHMMAGIRGKDTKPELALRRSLHALGLRYRLHTKNLSGKPDIVLPKHHAVIFVHGCFWHRHAGCRYATVPATRPEFWKAKFDANVARDAAVQSDLLEAGWRVGTVWECALRTDTGISQARDAVKTWLHCGGSSLEVGATNVASASCPGDTRLCVASKSGSDAKLRSLTHAEYDRIDALTVTKF